MPGTTANSGPASSGTTASARARPVLATLRRDIFHVDRSRVSVWVALRNTVGVVLPLAVGAAEGHLGTGLTVAIGALNVAFSDRPGPYRLRTVRMLATTLAAALSSFLGVLTAHAGWGDVALVVVWGLAAGMLAALGPAATQIGTAAVILLLVLGAQSAQLPFSATHAVWVGLFVALGGLLQSVLSVAAWPLRRFGPERRALAALFGQLAATARRPSESETAPPVTDAMSETTALLSGVGSDRGRVAEALRSLAADAERIRGEVLALAAARARLAGPNDRSAGDLVGAVLEAAAVAMVAVAGTLRGEDTGETGATLAAYDDALAALTRAVQPVAAPPRALVIAEVRARALRGQLRAALDLARYGDQNGEETEEVGQLTGARPAPLRLRDPLAILAANVSWDSAVLRHAVRLAVALLVAATGTHLLHLPRGYWIGLTVAIVLRPDFAATFSRGLGRVGGTLLGLGVATGLAYAAHGSTAVIVSIGLLVLAARIIGPANFALSGTAVTGLVVLLTALAGARPETTILDRGLDTLLGGLLALGLYALWPTWERGQLPGRLGDLLDAYRAYTAIVLAGWIDPASSQPDRRDAPRRRARLARSNAEASVDRLRGEPVRAHGMVDLAENLLAGTHRLALAALALEAHLADTPGNAAALSSHVDGPALERFAATVDRCYRVLEESVRHRQRPRGVPDVRKAQTALADQCAGPDPGLAVLVQESDRIAHGLDTVAHLLRRAYADPAPAERPISTD